MPRSRREWQQCRKEQNEEKFSSTENIRAVLFEKTSTIESSQTHKTFRSVRPYFFMYSFLAYSPRIKNGSIVPFFFVNDEFIFYARLLSFRNTANHTCDFFVTFKCHQAFLYKAISRYEQSRYRILYHFFPCFSRDCKTFQCFSYQASDFFQGAEKSIPATGTKNQHTRSFFFQIMGSCCIGR